MNKFLTEKIGDISELENIDNSFPSKIVNWHGGTKDYDSNSTHFGYVYSGSCQIEYDDNVFNLKNGMSFSIPGKFKIHGDGIALIVGRIGVFGLFYICGKIEKEGRLKYIDGCTDTLLIPPVLIGYPCSNFLRIPPNVNQTSHTHPSVRVGLVISGSGICRTPDKDYQFSPGTMFILPPEGIHSFHTLSDELRIVVYHPDSDFGPSNDAHPMLNKTYVDGVSASKIDSIRTK